MKKTIAIIAVALFASAFQPEKSFQLTEGQANILFQSLEISKKVLPTATNISALDASTALFNIDSIQKVLIKQHQKQTK